MPSQSNTRRVLIVGAGIGGLTLATALRRSGIEPWLIDKLPRLEPVGAGIILNPNALAVLAVLGLKERVVAKGCAARSSSLRAADNRVLTRLSSAGFPAIALHRGELQQALLSGIDQRRLKLGTTVELLRQGEQCVDVTYSDGAQETFDVVIGADGIRSQIRALTFAGLEPVYAGYTCWRAVVENIDLPAENVEMWGRGQRMGIVPLPGKRAYTYLTANAPPGTPFPCGETMEAFRDAFGQFRGDAPRILRAIDDLDALIRHDLEELPTHAWHCGRVALLGDAAHALTPNMGQGAAMAIEDAYVLAQVLIKPHSPREAFDVYQRVRQARVKQIQEISRRIGMMGQWSGRVSTWLRDGAMRRVPARLTQRRLQRLFDGNPTKT